MSRAHLLLGVFADTPLHIGAFGDPDWEGVLAPLIEGGIALDSSGRKEIANWSGGIPILTAALLSKLADVMSPGSKCTKAEVDAIARPMLGEHGELLAELWSDCDAEVRGDVAVLAAKTGDGIPLSDLSHRRQRELEQRGLAATVGNRMQSSCRLMAEFALRQAPAAADLRRLFGTPEGFETHIRTLLELRLKQVIGSETDDDLRTFVYNAVRDLEPDPKLALTWIRSIANRALDLIWNAELGQSRKIPADWIDEWKQAGERLPWLEASQRLPVKIGPQCNVLRLATGADRIRPRAKFVTKPTALLIDALQSVGDFGQHRTEFRESSVSVGFAAIAALSAIELAASLARDFSRKTDSR